MRPSNEKETPRVEPTKQDETPRKGESGRDAENAELTVKDLEERVAPVMGWTGNHNETLLADR